LEIIQLSKFTYSMLSILSNVAKLVSVLVYGFFLTGLKFRSLLFLYSGVNLLDYTLKFILAERWNLAIGMSDQLLIVFMNIEGAFRDIMLVMCVVVLFNKLSPHHIEATAFATYSSIKSLCIIFLAPNVGALLCKQFGIDNDHLDRYSILVGYSIICQVIGFFLVFLIPKDEEVEELCVFYAKEKEEEEQRHLLKMQQEQ
jgi:BT1 family